MTQCKCQECNQTTVLIVMQQRQMSLEVQLSAHKTDTETNTITTYEIFTVVPIKTGICIHLAHVLAEASKVDVPEGIGRHLTHVPLSLPGLSQKPLWLDSLLHMVIFRVATLTKALSVNKTMTSVKTAERTILPSGSSSSTLNEI